MGSRILTFDLDRGVSIRRKTDRRRSTEARSTEANEQNGPWRHTIAVTNQPSPIPPFHSHVVAPQQSQDVLDKVRVRSRGEYVLSGGSPVSGVYAMLEARGNDPLRHRVVTSAVVSIADCSCPRTLVDESYKGQKCGTVSLPSLDLLTPSPPYTFALPFGFFRSSTRSRRSSWVRRRSGCRRRRGASWPSRSG